MRRGGGEAEKTTGNARVCARVCVPVSVSHLVLVLFLHARLPFSLSVCACRLFSCGVLISQRFHAKLLAHVHTHHEAHLATLPGRPSVPLSRLQRWHKAFDLQAVPGATLVPLGVGVGVCDLNHTRKSKLVSALSFPPSSHDLVVLLPLLLPPLLLLPLLFPVP